MTSILADLPMFVGPETSSVRKPVAPARDTRNISASVRARPLARSRAESTDFPILLTRYGRR
jgi:hypothetical protein